MRRLLPVLVLVAVAVQAWPQVSSALYARGHRDLGAAWPDQPTVVLAVLDTVRADHLAACGYERNVGWFLVELVEDGAALTCDARAPGSWTLPSHASFFTGLQVVEHGAHPVAGGEALAHTRQQVRALRGVPTLAEQLRGQGYQTVAVVENPVVSAASGLLRGFDHVVRAEGWLELEEDDGTYTAVRDLVRRELDPSAPLFLFLNLASAHQPWPAIEEDRPRFLPERPALRLLGSREGSVWRRFHRDELTPKERDELLAHLTDVYDHGIWRAVRTLRRVWRLLERDGWAREARLVVTSDHGEFLGEQGRLDHGHYLDDANSRVPLLYCSSSGAGELPDELPRVEAVAFPHPERERWAAGLHYGQTSAAILSSAGVTTWVDGVVSGEEADAVGELADAAISSAAGEGDAGVVEVLRAVGYVE